LENLTIYLEKRGSQGLSLVHDLTDRSLKRRNIDWTPDAHQRTQLPLGTKATRFLGKPNVQLRPRQRK
jgi:hypothetical protein